MKLWFYEVFVNQYVQHTHRFDPLLNLQMKQCDFSISCLLYQEQNKTSCHFMSLMKMFTPFDGTKLILFMLMMIMAITMMILHSTRYWSAVRRCHLFQVHRCLQSKKTTRITSSRHKVT